MTTRLETENEQKSLPQTCLSPKNQQDTLSMYGDWAATYDQTMKDHDYQSPRRIVEALCGIVQTNLLPYSMLVVALACPGWPLPRRVLQRLMDQMSARK